MKLIFWSKEKVGGDTNLGWGKKVGEDTNLG
jgi:hypothetical protein